MEEPCIGTAIVPASFNHFKIFGMATNGKSGDNRRYGAVRDRSQVFNSQTLQWVKRDASTGKFMGVKSDGTPFKGIRRESK